MLLASCGQEATPVTKTTLSPVQLPTVVPSPIPPTFMPRRTLTPSPRPIPSEIPTPTLHTSKVQYQVYDLNMVDDGIGWAVFLRGDISDGQFWLGRTTDGGHTWINVTPPAFKAIRSDMIVEPFPLYYSPRYGNLKVSALDSETAWAHPSRHESTATYDEPSVIWRTDDGGLSWKTLTVPSDCREWRLGCIPDSLQFVDRQNGWIHMVVFGRNYLRHDFYRTVDGGETWEKLPRIDLASGGANFVFDPVFVDVNFGWKMAASYRSATIADIKAYGLSGSEITRDGGYTWRMVALPLSPGLIEAVAAQQIPDTQRIEVDDTFLQMGSGVVSILTNLKSDAFEPPFFSAYYFSSDQGWSWHPVSNVGDTFFLNKEIGWRLANTNLMALEKTTDGGVTWETFPEESWGLERDEEVVSIVHTTDGGAKRTEIQPLFFDDEFWPGQGVRLESMYMEDTMTGWGVEAGGTTVCTINGAQIWLPCQPPPETIRPIEVDLPETKGNWWPDEALPHELFHGGEVPYWLQIEIDQSRQFLEHIEEQFNPFQYHCSSQSVDRLGGGMVGVARQCAILYPTDYHPDFGFELSYWLYHYYVLYDNGDSRIWPNVVSMDFTGEHVGHQLLNLNNGFFRVEGTMDAGETWTEMKTVAWIGELEFVTSQEGWSIARVPPMRGIPTYQFTPDLYREAVVLHTIDGGLTWEEIHPVVGP